MPTMNMEVIASFVDNLTGPARAAAEALDAIKASAERLAAIGSRMTESLSGFRTIGADMAAAGRGAESLAKGLRAVETVSVAKLDGIAGALERLKQAATGDERATNGLSGMGAGADRANTSMERLLSTVGSLEAKLAGLNGAALERVARSTDLAAERAGRAAPGREQAVRSAITSSAPGPGISLAGSSFVGDRSHGSIRGGGISHGLVLGGAIAGREALHLGRYILNEGGDLEAELANAKQNGLSDSDVAMIRRKAEDVATTVPQTNVANNVKAIMALRAENGGHLDEAVSSYQTIAKAGAVVGSRLGKDKADQFSDTAFQMIRPTALKNVIGDENKFHEYIEGMARTAIFTAGKVTPESYHSAAVYSRGALPLLSDEFFIKKFPFLMQELSARGQGSQAGATVAQMGAVASGQIASRNIQENINMGLVDPTMVEGAGVNRRVMPGGVINGELAKTDPAAYARWRRSQIEAHGVVGKDAVLAQEDKLTGNQRARQGFKILEFQDDRLNSFAAAQSKVMGVDDLYSSYGQTYKGASAALSGATASASQTIGLMMTPLATGIANALTSALTTWRQDHGGGGTEGGKPLMGATADLLAVRGGMTAAPFFARMAASMPFMGGIAETVPWLARAAALANPYTDAAMGGLLLAQGVSAVGGGLTVPENYVGRGELGSDPRQRAVTAATASKMDRHDYANMTDSAPMSVPLIKAPDPIRLPDATEAGATAGSQVAAGVIAAQGQVAAAAQTLMAAIRAAVGGGVNVPVHLEGGAAGAALAGSGGLSGGARRGAFLSPAVRVAAAGPVTKHNTHQTVHIAAINVQGKADPKATAQAVHEEFRQASRAQLSDGIYS